MQAINFVIRSSVGGIQSGVVSGQAGNSTVFLQENEQISLHLARHQISGYERAGSDLVITLVDGREITLSGYFGADGDAANRLFISSEDAITELTLVDAGENSYFAQYGSAENWGKWAPDQQMVFYEEAAPLSVADAPVAAAYEEETVSMLGAGALLAPVVGGGGAGALAAAGGLVAGGLVAGSTILGGDTDGSGGGTDGAGGGTDGAGGGIAGPGIAIDTTPSALSFTSGVVSKSDVHNASEYNSGITIKGTGEPKASVSVEIEGATHKTTVDGNGDWSVTFDKSELKGGTYTVPVKIVTTDNFGNSATYTDKLEIDTETNASISGKSAGGDNIVNLVESGSDVVVFGTAEGGASIVFEVYGNKYYPTADAAGNWSIKIPKENLPTGERTLDMTLTATDKAGNVATRTGELKIDTIVNTLSVTSDSSGSDNWVNASEMANGLVLGGKVEAGSQSVTIKHNTVSYNATVDAAGNWTATVPSSAVGQGSFAYTVQAVDGAGNTRDLNASVMIDTQAPDAANILWETSGIVNSVKVLRVLEIEDKGDTYSLYTVDQNGVTERPNQKIDPENSGVINIKENPLPLDGTSLVIAAEDNAGNVTGTYFVSYDVGELNVDADTLMNTGLNIDVMDLRSADVNLTLTEAQIKALSENSDQVSILGDDGDSVTIKGAKLKETFTDAHGNKFDVYTLGDATVLIDD